MLSGKWSLLATSVPQVSQMFYDRSRYALNYRTGDETFIGILPFHHIYGKVVIMLAGLVSGAKIVILPKFEPKLFLDTLQHYAVSVVCLTYINL